MKDLELFLTALAARVYEARVGGMPLKDVTDFRAWLFQCAIQAARYGTVEEFFRALDGDHAPRRGEPIIINGDSHSNEHL